MSTKLAIDSIKLKAAIEFGDYVYTVKNGGHGPTLVVDAGTKEKAAIARKKIPGNWEGLFVLVVYSYSVDFEEESLYDPAS
jgi:predicted sugar kinase